MSIKPLNTHYSITANPAAYDEEAMTALELSSSILGKANELVEGFNELEKNTDDTLTAQNKRLSDMENEQIPETVNNVVENKVNDGTFDAMVDNHIGNLKTRINNLENNYTPGSTTADAELIDLRVGSHGVYPTAGEAVRGEINYAELDGRTAYDFLSDNGYIRQRNIFNPNTLTAGMLIEGEGINNTGAYADYYTTDFINVFGHKTITVVCYNASYDAVTGGRRTIVFFTKAKTEITGGYHQTQTGTSFTVDIPVNAAYARVCFVKVVADGRLNIKLDDTDTRYVAPVAITLNGDRVANVCETVEKMVVKSINLFDKTRAVAGVIEKNGVVNPSDIYTVTDFIKVEKGDTVNINQGVRQIAFYDEYKTHITTDTSFNNTAASVVVAFDGFVRVAFFNNRIDTAMIVLGELPDYYVSFGYEIPNLKTPMFITPDVLSGKTWYACGDSFTAQGYDNSDPEPHTFTEGAYLGEQMVYPFYIGRRTGMVVKNLARGGMTMAATSTGNNFINDIYKNIGADADYITLKFGINDGHQNVPIGTIDSTDINTFYGAFNVVMTHIITNHPLAKIGIIVSNGLDDESYAIATKAIAAKYGVPTLNEWDDPATPLVIRSGRKDVNSTIKAIRERAFAVDYDGTRTGTPNRHPNNAAQEYESIFIESWLRTL